MADAAGTARSMWTLFEPIHAVIYFTQEGRSAFERAGLRGFWRGYFAGRAAPLGQPSAAVVTASFFGFAPGMVARAIPGIWELISPADALRTLFLELMAYEQPLRHMGELIAGSGFRYPLPDPGSHPLAGTFAPDLPLRTGDGKTTSVAELMRAARPVFLDLAGRSDLLEAARPWEGRVDIHAATTDDRPADALLIRPDACIAWAATACQPAGAVAPALPEALFRWFGAPLDETVPVTGWSS